MLARMSRPVRLGIVGTALLLLLGVAWARAGAEELEEVVVGTWECAGVYTDTPAGSWDRSDEFSLPAPFDVFAGEIDKDALYTQEYRPPRSGAEFPAASARVAVQADGRFVTNGIEIFGEQYRTGSWTREDGMFVVRFDGDRPNNHAMRLDLDDGGGEVLTWRDPAYTPEFTEVRIDRHDAGFTARFSTSADSFAWRCTKFSDDLSTVGY